MAEEKIRILVATDPCETCKLKPFPRKCMFSILYEKAKGITRQEAIEKMAKAFFKSWYGEGFEQENTDLKRRYKESAEAALNALLEGK